MLSCVRRGDILGDPEQTDKPALRAEIPIARTAASQPTPAGSFSEGFRTTAPLLAAPPRWAVIQNPESNPASPFGAHMLLLPGADIVPREEPDRVRSVTQSGRRTSLSLSVDRLHRPYCRDIADARGRSDVVPFMNHIAVLPSCRATADRSCRLRYSRRPAQ